MFPGHDERCGSIISGPFTSDLRCFHSLSFAVFDLLTGVSLGKSLSLRCLIFRSEILAFLTPRQFHGVRTPCAARTGAFRFVSKKMATQSVIGDT